MVSRSSLNVKALQSCRFRYYLVVTAALTISAFHHGFQMFVFNNPEKIIVEWLNNHTSTNSHNNFTLYSTTVAIFSAGGAIGSSLTFLANARFGSVKIIIICGFGECIGFLISFSCGFLRSAFCLIFGRFLSGMAIGLADGVTVLFLVEISPTLTRGLILTAFELTLVNGVVGSQIGGLPLLFGTRKKWLIMMFTSALGSIAPVVIMWFSPESPRYLLQKFQDEEAAKKSLTWFRKAEFVDKEFEELKKEASFNNIEAPSEPLACRLFLCLKVVTTEAACGFIILLYFSTAICKSAGVKVLDPHYTTLVMGASLTFGTLLSLHLVDICGRKRLLLISLQFSSCITYFVIIFFYAAEDKAGRPPAFKGLIYFIMIILLSVVYGFGIGSSRWIAMVEHFRYKIRPAAVSITLPANFFINFLIAQTFLIVENYYKPILLIPCAVWGSCSFWVIYTKVPETKLRKEDLEKLDIYEDVIS